MKPRHFLYRLICAWIMAFALTDSARAQWQTQSVTLKPGWNAVFLHVDASHVTLDNLVTNGPIAEVWLWQTAQSSVQFVESPALPTAPNSQWAVWYRSPLVSDTLSRLVGNAAYLVNNTNTVDYVWNITGKAVPPRYQWTTSGLNFIGFPTPTNTAPNFDNFLSPIPDFQHSAEIYRYPGGSLGSTNPVRVNEVLFRSTPVTRGQAFWIRAGTAYNNYYGPVEVSLQNASGVNFGDSLGTYSLRLRNLTSSNRTVTLNLLASVTPPAGQPAIVGPPPLLVRGALNLTNLTYAHTVLSGPQSFTLTPAGQDGSNIEVVLGLNRSAMTAPTNSLYAGILRFADTLGLEQIDLPVTAIAADAAGLWLGEASVTQVGHYLKTYAQATNAANLTAVLASNNLLTEVRSTNWTPRDNTRQWRSVASSIDGSKLVAVVSGGQIYTSVDSGTNWVARDVSRNWRCVASSADGSKLVAAVSGGQIYTSTDSGATWVARDTNRTWSSVASSADGTKLVAVNFDVSVGTVYRSTDSGVTWTPITTDAVLNANDRWWTGVASSADGTTLVAVNNGFNPGQYIYVSTDSGATWQSRMTDTPRRWNSVAMSSDGEKMVAVDTGHINGDTNGGRIYISTDHGASWSASGPATNWTAVACSANGERMVATVGTTLNPATTGSGQIYTSIDGGKTWRAHETSREWVSVASSADGTKLVAAPSGARMHTSTGAFPNYQIDTNTSRVVLMATNGAPYVATATNTSLGAVARPFPLRLILHNNAAANDVKMLQRVYFGQRFATNAITIKESLLDAATIGSARRISATHLPYALTNTPVTKTSGTFGLGSSLVFNVDLDYNDQASNPFLHTFHPDHDNLKADFRTVEVQGAESYTVSRQITLTFAPPAGDFGSITTSTRTLGGNYTEVISFKGLGGQSRDFTIAGTFILNRISNIATLTTN